MALMEISIIPLGTGSTSLGRYVAEVKRYLEERGIPHTLTDMGTIIEGEVEDLFRIARELHEIPFKAGAKRVYTALKIDDRRDKEVHLGTKVESVKRYLSS
ncbi:MAG: MTH1187 family thiamine-binding protein [Thermodesulfobacteria bacterium]|nr:MTH1187 family thiamine-binding protein [Thermodesulfobacteriota bacterium]